MLENKNDGNGSLVKVDISTWTIIKTVKGLNIDHGNDLAYNPKTNQIIVCHNAPNRTKISFFNADTLEYVTTKTLKVQIFSVSYNANYDMYVVGISYGYNFALLDGNFNVLKTYTGKGTGYTTQGGDCDDNYIYFIQSDSNCIVVYDWSGKYITTASIPLTVEAENIFHIGDTFYISYYISSGKGGRTYQTTIVVK